MTPCPSNLGWYGRAPEAEQKRGGDTSGTKPTLSPVGVAGVKRRPRGRVGTTFRVRRVVSEVPDTGTTEVRGWQRGQQQHGAPRIEGPC